MITEFKMPKMGESISEATIISWLKNVGDFVDAEESVKTGRLEDKLSVELLIIKYSSKVK